MKKMKKNAGAIGFAVYLDSLERLNLETPEYDVDIVLIIGENSPETAIKKAEELSEDGKRVLVLKTLPKDIRYKVALDINGKELFKNA
jgi:ATP phosphoribosyltransferase regulatory subunit